MANYSGGTKTICPFYQKESEKSISCDVLEGVCKVRMCFQASKDRVRWQQQCCFSYDFENRCPIALALAMHAEYELHVVSV